ncbi:nitroreductase [Exilibacterium tricleocarpae]|uniref:Nitroreductase n=1 Tax=Exilibacterium tricleocarpae TaxID=2591008 RepID=A0A545TS55_9GAMM|nr:nitroreductase [Exilibacterium tricleocarpae]TQV80054.1 nitroreductase [Exilibacterium tricleocarpae]
MDFSAANQSRRSIRAFSKRPVERDVLGRILRQALESPSWSNTQPYRVAIAQGELIETLRVELPQKFWRINALRRSAGWQKLFAWLVNKDMPDGDFRPVLKYPEELQRRRSRTGLGLYDTLGIARQDYRARDEQMARNFSFFDAPVALFVFMHKGLGVYSALDAGIFLQTLMLAATAEGLGSCAQGALAMWRSPLERHFAIPDDYQLLCGVSLGYPSDDKVNQYRPPRRGLEELVLPARTQSDQ